MINGEAVCSGYTESFKTFMDMLGIENYTISGKAGNEQHIWNAVLLDQLPDGLTVGAQDDETLHAGILDQLCLDAWFPFICITRGQSM